MNTEKHPHLLRVGVIVAVVFCVGMIGVILNAEPAVAKTPTDGIFLPMRDADEQQSVGKEECLVCHQIEGMVLPLANGDDLYLTISSDGFANSVHGQLNFDCVACHTDFTGYPHPDLSAVDRRSVSILLNRACSECHTDQAELYSEGRHAASYAQGNLESALCVDCHSAHSVKDIRGLKVEIAKVCQQCHSDIYDIYKNSVHGAALIDEGNTDVPTCSDCHENHDNTGPSDEGYVLFSPEICADCHADEELMTKYDINTKVFDTYVSDFHGTTVTIFEKIAPDQETNKPVCIDCHSVHDIRSPEDAGSSVMKDNLLVTCQRCHPDATIEFDDSWLGHYSPDLEKTPIVYLVNLFYYVVIPTTVVGMVFFIGTDIAKTLKGRRKKNGSGKSKGGSSHE